MHSSGWSYNIHAIFTNIRLAQIKWIQCVGVLVVKFWFEILTVHDQQYSFATNGWIATSIDLQHYNDVIMGAIGSQITSLMIVYTTVYSDADQRKHQSSASLAFVRGIHGGPVNSPRKWPVTRKMFPFDDVIMKDVIIHIKTTVLAKQQLFKGHGDLLHSIFFYYDVITHPWRFS